MEVRFESMVFLWDDKIPTMFLEFMNLLTLCQSEEQLRRASRTLPRNTNLTSSSFTASALIISTFITRKIKSKVVLNLLA